MFQTGGIEQSGAYETSDHTANLSMCPSEEGARYKVTEGYKDQDENSLPTRSFGAADNAHIAATKDKKVTKLTKDSREEETFAKPVKVALTETQKERTRLEKSRTKAEEKAQYTGTGLPVKECMISNQEIPGSWKKGEFPSSTLTSPKFSQTKRNKISAQRYPCFVPNPRKKVKIKG